MSTQPHTEPEHEAPGHAPHEGQHSGHGKHKKGHGGHGGGGGHGGSWIVTYSDMITLLMAFFICIITFSSKEPEKYSPKKDMLVGGSGGSGIASQTEAGSLERDSVVWRLRMRQARLSQSGSEMAPMYRNPSMDVATRILQALEGAVPGQLADNFAIPLPVSLLFEKDDRLSSSGAHVLHAIAGNLRELPYDLRFQVTRAGNIPQAIMMCNYLMTQESYEPARLAVGSRPPRQGDGDSIWLVLARQF